MPILNPFLNAGGVPVRPITAPQRKRRKKMNQAGFYEEEPPQPTNAKLLGTEAGGAQQQQFVRPPESGDYIAEHLAKMKSRAAPPELTPGSRVKNADLGVVNANNFKTYYDQLGLLKQLDNDRTAAAIAEGLQRRQVALRAIGNSGGGQSQGGGSPAGQLKYSGGGNVMGWISQAADILRQNGINLSPQDMQYVAIMIQHESGGNPNAINLWDSNAKAGIPSKGLMQTIDPTFNSNKLAGYNDIYNPVHNILAGVRYAIRRYGSIANVPGIRNLNSGRGYVGY